ncbi:MAG: hypothetical protein K8L91_22440 [Anaerolineae bacterium]|nr:hypothetical protein [Anaerolineae bacterium]
MPSNKSIPKTATKTMPAVPPPNYPDLIGLVTNKKPINIDIVQCAVATRPTQVIAGQNFELIVLLQNPSDMQINVVIMPKLPEEDAAKHPHMFATPSQRIRVVLQPAEVGYVIIPAVCLRKAAPGHYPLITEIHAELMDKTQKPARVRLPEGGGDPNLGSLAEEVRLSLLSLRKLRWDAHVDTWRKHNLNSSFDVITAAEVPAIAVKGSWNSLWTMRDYLDENVLRERVKPQVDAFLVKLVAPELIKSINEATLEWFNKTGYVLQAVEALYVSKVLTHVLCELKVEQPTKINPNPTFPDWYNKLTWVFFDDPRLVDYPDRVIKGHLYPELIKDAVRHSFRMLTTVLKEDFGTVDEINDYAENISSALQNNTELTYAQVYLPLIAAGIIIANRLTMSGENVTNSLHQISEAQTKRKGEFNEDNAFIVEIINKLVDRSLEYKF